MQIGIVGLGLIGGSFCKAISQRTGHVCYGFDLNEETLAQAKQDGAIRDVLTDERLGEMDMTIVCLHPKQTIAYITDHAALFKKGSLVTDSCGVKQAVVDAVSPLLAAQGVTFIGAHPMAGREFSGYEYALPTLFDRASFILTPQEGEDPEKVQLLTSFAEEIGFFKLVRTTPAEHDRVIAFTSQLAHVVSNAYVKSPSIKQERGFSAGSFLDLTRVAKLNEDMWTDLFLFNKEPLLFELDTIIAHLQEYRQAIAEGDEKRLKALLKEGRILKEESLMV